MTIDEVLAIRFDSRIYGRGLLIKRLMTYFNIPKEYYNLVHASIFSIRHGLYTWLKQNNISNSQWHEVRAKLNINGVTS
jgi:hypothetical protein